VQDYQRHPPMPVHCETRAALQTILEQILGAEWSCAEDRKLSGAKGIRLSSPPSAYTIAEFCEAYRISRAHLYVLLRKGDGPKTFTAGRRRLIGRDAAAEWVRRNEARATARFACEGQQQ
jgi:excisionase family DNA binding protein